VSLFGRVIRSLQNKVSHSYLPSEPLIILSKMVKQATSPSSEVDWKTLGFVERDCNGHIAVTYKDGKWGEPVWKNDMNININVASPALNYGQQCFEGIKVSTMISGGVRLRKRGRSGAEVWRKIEEEVP